MFCFWVELHMWPQQKWVKGHLGIFWVTNFNFLFVNQILERLQVHVIAKASEPRGSRTAFLNKLIKC